MTAALFRPAKCPHAAREALHKYCGDAASPGRSLQERRRSCEMRMLLCFCVLFLIHTHKCLHALSRAKWEQITFILCGRDEPLSEALRDGRWVCELSV